MCEQIPVRVISLSDSKFTAARAKINAATTLQNVTRWNAVRGSDMFDDANSLLPNYKDILHIRYPQIHVPHDQLLSTQAQLVLSSGVRTNIYDLHNAGAVGCALSHISLWQHMVDNQLPAMIVFEDDVAFDQRFQDDTTLFCKQLRIVSGAIDFDVLNFNLVLIPSPLQRATEYVQTDVDGIIEIKGIALRMQGYLMTLQGAKTLLEAGPFPLLHIVDAYMSMLTVLPQTKDRFKLITPQKPWLEHPLLDTSSSQIGYPLLQCCTDALFFIPPIALLCVIALCLLLILVLIVIAVRHYWQNCDKAAEEIAKQQFQYEL